MARIAQYDHPQRYPNVHWEIDQPQVRSELPARKSPYWFHLATGRAIGLVKGKSWRWAARMTKQGGRSHRFQSLGYTDDSPYTTTRYHKLTFDRAAELAKEWFDLFDDGIDPNPVPERHTSPPQRPGGDRYTVGHALIDLLWHVHSTGADWRRLQTIFTRHIMPEIGSIALGSLEARDVEAWKRGTVRKPRQSTSDEAIQADSETLRKRRKSANTYLSSLKQALNLAYLQGHIQTDQPWRSVKGFSNVDRRRREALDDWEINALIASSRSDFSVFICGLLFSGCRGAELMRANVEDYSSVAGKLRVLDGKHHRLRAVVIGGRGKTFFDDLTTGRLPTEPLFVRADGRRWNDASQNWAFAEAKQKAGLDLSLTVRAFRNTYATRAALGGMPIRFLAQQLGHLNINTTEKFYVQFDESEVDAIIRSHLPSILNPAP